MKHFIYILKCSDDSLYTGYTTDVDRREAEHNGESTKPGARYTRGRRPVKVVYSESFSSRSQALKREAEIKSLKRKQKEQLIK